MNKEILDLINRIDNLVSSNVSVIPWGAPIVSFGDISRSEIATLGINPSNKEFMDDNGNELSNVKRRFHTLNSLEISKWSETQGHHIAEILNSCNEYFYRNPYDSWFKPLDYIISGTSKSYYFPSSEACHLDLIPYATSNKWGALTGIQKKILLNETSDTLGMLLKMSPIQVLVLNGKTVVEIFNTISDVKYKIDQVEDWSLPRQTKSVKGYSYIGKVKVIGDIKLPKEIKVLGYNHNIQSSYGVTKQVHNYIRDWVTQNI